MNLFEECGNDIYDDDVLTTATILSIDIKLKSL